VKVKKLGSPLRGRSEINHADFFARPQEKRDSKKARRPQKFRHCCDFVHYFFSDKLRKKKGRRKAGGRRKDVAIYGTLEHHDDDDDDNGDDDAEETPKETRRQKALALGPLSVGIILHTLSVCVCVSDFLFFTFYFVFFACFYVEVARGRSFGRSKVR